MAGLEALFSLSDWLLRDGVLGDGVVLVLLIVVDVFLLLLLLLLLLLFLPLVLVLLVMLVMLIFTCSSIWEMLMSPPMLTLALSWLDNDTDDGAFFLDLKRRPRAFPRFGFDFDDNAILASVSLRGVGVGVGVGVSVVSGAE